jgi:hypothetical protein
MLTQYAGIRIHDAYFWHTLDVCLENDNLVLFDVFHFVCLGERGGGERVQATHGEGLREWDRGGAHLQHPLRDSLRDQVRTPSLLH